MARVLISLCDVIVSLLYGTSAEMDALGAFRSPVRNVSTNPSWNPYEGSQSPACFDPIIDIGVLVASMMCVDHEDWNPGDQLNGTKPTQGPVLGQENREAPFERNYMVIGALFLAVFFSTSPMLQIAYCLDKSYQ